MTTDSAEPALIGRKYRLADLKKLFALSYNECALPACEEKLANPDWPRVLAVICHIYGLRPGSARHVSGMSAGALNAYENLLLLCRNCHAKVDELFVDEYPAERLFDIKRSHEEQRTRSEWCPPSLIDTYVEKLALTLRIQLVHDGGPRRQGPTKIRAYELARELGLTNKEALDLCLDLGIEVKSHSSSIEDNQADRVRRRADQLGLRREVSPPEPD